MVTASAVSCWLLRRASGRWPAGIRAVLLREWTAEIQTIARDRSLSRPRRAWLMLTFATSLALARPGGEPAYAPLGVKRIAAVVAAVSGYLLVLALLQRGWSNVFASMAEGERPIVDDPGLAARLVQAAVALAPVALAVVAGWLLGRVAVASPRGVRPLSLGLCLIAVVAAWVGIGFVVDRLNLGYEISTLVPLPPTMSYSFGNQPFGMITSWAVWLAAFVLLAALVRRAAGRRRAIWRALAGTAVAVAVAGVAVTAATFVQFGAATAPRSEIWKWFAQWLVPPHPFQSAVDEGADSFHSARTIYLFVSSYPHVLLAVAGFGVAFLLANTGRSRSPTN
jgi:hypothetical protein